MLPLMYEGVRLRHVYRADITVRHLVFLEIKSIGNTLRVYEAQLMTYLRLSGRRIGPLISFDTAVQRDDSW